MKKVLELILSLVRKLFPRSRWANIAYLLIGFALANWERIEKLIDEIVKLF